MNQNTLIGILIPFAGTALGSAMVFFMKKEMNGRLQKVLLGFASGVMIAASVWSLLIPAIDMAEQKGGVSWLPPAVGFLFGMGFLLALDTLTPHLHFTDDKTQRSTVTFKKNNHACPGSNAPQYTGRYGGRCYVCRSSYRQPGYDSGGSLCAFCRDCHSEFPGRCDYFHAAEKPGNFKKGVHLSTVRSLES